MIPNKSQNQQYPDNLEQQERQKLVQIKQFLQTRLQDPFQREEALKIANTHFWLNQNSHQLAQQLFSFNKIQQKLNEFDPSTAQAILFDENYGPVINRANIVIEFILDKVIEGIDQAIKEEYIKKENNEQCCMPIIEYATNIFPDVNLFMIFPDTDNIPQDVQIFKEKVREKIFQAGEQALLKEIQHYFGESWPIYSKNIELMSQGIIPLSHELLKQLYTGEEGQCYPSQKRNPVSSFPLN